MELESSTMRVTHIGGIYHFVNTLKKILMTTIYDKVIVFWDGEITPSQRKTYLPVQRE